MFHRDLQLMQSSARECVVLCRDHSDSDTEEGLVMDDPGEVGRDQVIQGHEEEP